MWDEAEKYLIKDKYISPLIRKWGSCQIKQHLHKDYFEHLCANIIGQQLSGKAADTIFARFKKRIIEMTPDNIIKTEDKDLRECGLSWAKVRYVKDLAQRTEDGRLDTKRLGNLSDDDIVRELTAVKGIGRWTAEMFLMFTLARPDLFPVDDLGIRKSFEKVTGRKWDKVKSAKFALRWKPWRSVASWYLWKSLDN